MASDPLAGYSPTADPLSGYSATPAPSSADLGTTAIWNKPANVGWGDYMLAHLAQALPNNPLDPHVNANEAVLLGSGLSGGLSGFIPGMRERTAQAEQETPLGNRIALQGAGYILGPGKLRIASNLGEGASSLLGSGKVAQWTGGVLGSAGEGALASGAGEAGAGGSASDVGKAAVVGALAGGGGGALGGVVGRGGTLPPAQTADDLRAAATKAYDPLSNVLYDATKEVHPALDPIDAQNALRDWSGYKWGDASKTSKEIQTLLDKPQLSANDIQQSQSYLEKKIANNPTSDVNDALYAKYYVKKLQGVLDDATPQMGVPQNWTPTPGGPPSFASAKKAEGDALFGQAKDAERLDKMVDASQVNQGPDVATQSRSYLTSAKGQRLAPQGSPQYDAYNTIADTSNKSGYVPWWVKHYVVAPTVGAGIMGGLGAVSGEAEGHSPWTHALEDAAIGAALGGFSGGYRGGTGAVNRAAQQRAIDAARSTFSTGQFQAPLMPDAPFRDAVRQLIFGQGAGGRF